MPLLRPAIAGGVWEPLAVCHWRNERNRTGAVRGEPVVVSCPPQEALVLSSIEAEVTGFGRFWKVMRLNAAVGTKPVPTECPAHDVGFKGYADPERSAVNVRVQAADQSRYTAVLIGPGNLTQQRIQSDNGEGSVILALA